MIQIMYVFVFYLLIIVYNKKKLSLISTCTREATHMGKRVNIIENMNQQQAEAITTTEGYVSVIAGAGSGKTRALTSRYAYLVQDLGVLPNHILCVTFTNKAAREMKSRIHEMLGDLDTGFLCTFHGLCVQILKEDGYHIQCPKNFTVIDDNDRDEILNSIFIEQSISSSEMTFAKAREYISSVKSYPSGESFSPVKDYVISLISLPESVLFDNYMSFGKRANRSSLMDMKKLAYLGYLYYQKKYFALDFNDLIYFTLYLLCNNSDVAKKWQEQFEYIMVDEFQDIDQSQYALMDILSQMHKNLFVVGDSDQLIYSWRGASPEIFDKFAAEHRPLHEIKMMQNYRSSFEILDAANSLIDKNKNRAKKYLVSTRSDCGKVDYYHAKTQVKEMSWVADNIEALAMEGIHFNDIAILYRAHYLSQPIEKELSLRKIPYKVYSGAPFFSRKEIKQALGYMNLLINHNNDLAFERIINVPNRNIGESRIDFLKQYAKNYKVSLYNSLISNITNPIFSDTDAEEFVRIIEKYSSDKYLNSVSGTFNAVMSDSGFEEMLQLQGSEERLDNYAELKRVIYDFEVTRGEHTNIDDLLKNLALFSAADNDNDEDRVKLMTVHAAKGLEFPYVFLIELNDGIFPSSKSKGEKEMEEERRLAFVAMTRAKYGLFVADSECTGFNDFKYPSRFLFEFGSKIPNFENILGSELFQKAKQYFSPAFCEDGIYTDMSYKNTLTLPAGTRIKHSVFGTGTILDYNRKELSYRVQFDSAEYPRSISASAKFDVMR